MSGVLRHAALKFWARGPRRGVPIPLRSVRIYILPTHQGALFAGVVLAMVAGSMNYNDNAGFLFAFLLAAMALMSTLYTQKNLKELTLVSEKHDLAFAGDRLWFDLALKANTASRYKISVGFQDEERITRDVPSGETVTFRVPHATEKRGLFHPEGLILSSTYPFGLFRTWVVIRINTDCLVFPKPLTHPFVVAQDPSTGDGTGELKRPGTDDFKELRPYQPGDPTHRIAWKTLARGQGVWTKTFEADHGSAVFISWGHIHTPSRETKIRHLCHLILEAHQQGLPYGLMVPGITIKPAEPRNIAHRDRCLTSLAMMA
ncbi:DUF58 domain-containing protein [Desulfoluna sp.]|uniref:DUF58 domain-containing protein n=1 Tax=Desulfoluna sp. TaxID=2045199 RepID=UPI00261BAFA7|nr:DUF58 domain-containing protein [Desulfoluna sp.]